MKETNFSMRNLIGAFGLEYSPSISVSDSVSRGLVIVLLCFVAKQGVA